MRLVLPVRLAGVGLGAAAFWLAAAGTLGAEILVESRRGPFLAGAARHFFSLSGSAEIAAFLLGLAAAHLACLYLLFRVVRLRRAGGGLAAYDFLAAAGLIWLGMLAVKSRLIGFFSARFDLDIARELGGGALGGALVYALDEALLVGALVAPALVAALLLRRFVRPTAPPPPPAPRRRHILLHLGGFAVVAGLLFWASTLPAAHFQLSRFGAPWLLLAGFDTASDLDRDGHGLFASPPDAAPLDAAIYPMALDLPGNGIDEDGFGGDLPPRPEPPEPTPVFTGERRHVVLVVLESTRAEAIGKLWGGRLVAPNLTALARGGSAAPEAYSNFAMTARSLKTIFTGRVLPGPGAPSLFRDFRAAGYRIGVFSSQSEDFGGIAEATGMRESADIFVDAMSIAAARGESGSAQRTVADGGILLAEMDRRMSAPEGWSRPTFLYFNFQAPHFPYTAPGTPDILPGRTLARSEISVANRDAVVRNYWNSVAYADRLLGELLRRLRTAGVYDRTTVVVVGDHGEELFEHGHAGHGTGLNALQTQVPLVFSDPVEMPRPVGLEGLRPLILRAAGATAAPPREGPVLQILGYFARPSLLGAVERGGRWTTFSPRTGEVWSDSTGSIAYRSLAARHPVRARVDRLVDAWMRARLDQQRAARARCGARWSDGANGAFEVDRERLCRAAAAEGQK